MIGWLNHLANHSKTQVFYSSWFKLLNRIGAATGEAELSVKSQSFLEMLRQCIFFMTLNSVSMALQKSSLFPQIAKFFSKKKK